MAWCLCSLPESLPVSQMMKREGCTALRRGSSALSPRSYMHSMPLRARSCIQAAMRSLPSCISRVSLSPMAVLFSAHLMEQSIALELSELGNDGSDPGSDHLAYEQYAQRYFPLIYR